MKVLIEPTRFKRLLETILIYKQKPLLESAVGEFKEKGLIVKNSSLDVVAVQAMFTKKYFLEYEATEENFPLTKTLLDPLNTGFKDEKINVFTEEGSIVIKGKTETYKEPLTEGEVGEIPFKMVNTEMGVIPEKLNPENPQVKGELIQVLLKGEDLQSIPTAEKFAFSCDGEKLTVTITNVGEYTKTFNPTKKESMGKMQVSFDGAYFANVVNNLEGDVWMSITEGAVVFSQKTKDLSLTYLLSSLEEG